MRRLIDIFVGRRRTLLVVTIAVLSNLVVDLFYAWLDPRIRLA